MRLVFNSLGSNYNFSTGIKMFKDLFVSYSDSKKKYLLNLLEFTFSGKATLIYNGRQALQLALESLCLPVDAKVLTQAFSCVVIEEAILKAKLKPVYYDLENNKSYPSLSTIKRAYDKKTRVLILQYTFGFAPKDLLQIYSWCKKQKIILIEDLCQGYGSLTKSNIQLGNQADFVVLSFGKDKILDAVIGGVLIDRRNKSIGSQFNFKSSGFIDKFKKGSYPLLTFFLRKIYFFPFGPILLFCLKKINYLENPTITFTNDLTSMPGFVVPLIIERFKTLNKQIKHRRGISLIYNQYLKKISLVTDLEIKQANNLRYPIRVENPQKLATFLEKKGYYLADRWYKKPVDGRGWMEKSNYQNGSCPNAENLSTQIFNLPTHINIDLRKAKELAELILIYTNAIDKNNN